MSLFSCYKIPTMPFTNHKNRCLWKVNINCNPTAACEMINQGN